MPRKFHIKKQELAASARNERKEHPWMTARQATRVASDHLSEHPTYNKAMSVAEQIMAKGERNIKPIRKRKPVQRNPSSLTIFRSPY